MNKRLLYIEWDDSIAVDGPTWIEADEISGDTLVRSCGFVVKENQYTISIAGHISEHGYISGTLTIPKAAIKKRRVVRVKP